MHLRTTTAPPGFTLIEITAVIGCIVIILTLLLAGITSLREEAHKATCVHNLGVIGTAIAMYAADHDGKIPYGPKAGPYTNAGSFYPSTGSPTSLISLQSGKPVALGLLLEEYLAHTPEVLFCPGNNNRLSASSELAKVGNGQAQSSYYYRHGGNLQLFDDPVVPTPEPPLKLAALGDNRRGKPIRALVIDTIFRCPPELKSFGIVPVSNHRELVANMLYTDGHVASRSNEDNRYTVDLRDYSQIRAAFSKILNVLENADEDY